MSSTVSAAAAAATTATATDATATTATTTAVIPAIRNVAVLAGTHGNELSGVFLHRFWSTEAGRRELSRDAIRVSTLLSNKLAVKRCVRYVDVDLNRTFKDEYCDLAANLTGDEEDDEDDDDVVDEDSDDDKCNGLDTLGKGNDESSTLPYEVKRVAEIMARLGNGRTDLAFDLHNTTSNSGLMLIIR